MIFDPKNVDKKIEELVTRRNELQKKRLLALSMGLGNHIHDQFYRMLEEVELDIYTYTELKKSNAKKDESDDGLII